MGELRITLPDDVHTRLKQKAIEKKTSIKALVPEIIEQYLTKDNQKTKSEESEGSGQKR